MLRLAVNRLAEKGEWDLDALKIEFNELIVTDAPIEIAGFSPAEINHLILGDGADGLEQGPLEPDAATAVAGSAIFSNSVRTASCVATRPILRFLLDCWKAMPPPVSS